MNGTTSRALRDYYLSFNLYSFGSGLVTVFLSLFFLTNYNFVAVLYFQLATYATALVAYLLASYLLRNLFPRHLYALGLSFMSFVLVDILSSTGVVSSALLVGLFWGTATGILYSGNNPLMYDITREADRTSFVATNNLLNGLVSLAAPSAAGLLVQFSTYSGAYKFLWDFAVTCGLFVVSALVMLRVKGDERSTVVFSLPKATRLAGESPTRFRGYFVLSQVFTIPFGILLPIYVFETTGSYLVAGGFASYLVLLSVLANFLFRSGYRREGQFPQVAVAGILLSSLTLFGGVPPPFNAFVFGGLVTLFSTPLNNMAMVEFMESMDASSRSERTLLWANREFYLGVGRVLVLLLLILLSVFLVSNSMNLVYLLPLLSLYSLIFLPLLRRHLPPHASADATPAGG
jgi:MFS family permease